MFGWSVLAEKVPHIEIDRYFTTLNVFVDKIHEAVQIKKECIK